MTILRVISGSHKYNCQGLEMAIYKGFRAFFRFILF